MGRFSAQFSRGRKIGRGEEIDSPRYAPRTARGASHGIERASTTPPLVCEGRLPHEKAGAPSLDRPALLRRRRQRGGPKRGGGRPVHHPNIARRIVNGTCPKGGAQCGRAREDSPASAAGPWHDLLPSDSGTKAWATGTPWRRCSDRLPPSDPGEVTARRKVDSPGRPVSTVRFSISTPTTQIPGRAPPSVVACTNRAGARGGRRGYEAGCDARRTRFWRAGARGGPRGYQTRRVPLRLNPERSCGRLWACNGQSVPGSREGMSAPPLKLEIRSAVTPAKQRGLTR